MRDTEEVLSPFGFFRRSNCSMINLRWVDGVKEYVNNK